MARRRKSKPRKLLPTFSRRHGERRRPNASRAGRLYTTRRGRKSSSCSSIGKIVFLERLSASIRARSGAAISRAQLIRTLLDAVAGAEVDLTTATSEPDLKASILALLGKSSLALSGV